MKLQACVKVLYLQHGRLSRDFVQRRPSLRRFTVVWGDQKVPVTPAGAVFWLKNCVNPDSPDS